MVVKVSVALSRIRIENYKSIKKCDIQLNKLNLLIGANGTGKTNILSAISYFYDNLTTKRIDDEIFDLNNKYSNQVKITLYFDLSEFYKITRSNNDVYSRFIEDEEDKSKYQSYYDSIIDLIASRSDKIFSIQMTQIKGKGIRWSESFEKRSIIKSLFPFFYIDTRNLDLTEWSAAWNMLGELSKVSNSERISIEESICEIIDKNPEIKNKIKGINEVFEDADLSIKKYTSKDFAKNLAKIYFSGEQIYQKGKKLKYFSSGTNSVKYIELLLRTITGISKTKMKEPIILFDEPEISLHTSFIDELSSAISEVDSRMRVLVSTHSSRLTKNLLTNSNDIFLYNVSLRDKNSLVNKMRKFSQYSLNSKYRVTDEHINSYFAKAVLFVEGETELELFANPYLKILFPQIKEIDIYKAMSDEPILPLMTPKKLKNNIPYLCLIDLDKAFDFKVETKKLVLKNEYFNKDLKEKYLFRNKKENLQYLLHSRRQIDNMSNKLHVHYYKPFYSCEDINYAAFVDAIHKYLIRHNVYTLSTTIEGTLINKHTMSSALEYLKSKKPRHYPKFEEYYNSCKNTDKLNSLRLVFNGKTDLLKSYSNIIDNLKREDREVFENMIIGKKTSGWVSEFLDSYFVSLIPEGYNKSPEGLKKCFKENAEMENSILKSFKYCFAELYDLMIQIFNLSK